MFSVHLASQGGPGRSVGWTHQELTKHSPGSQELLQGLGREKAPGQVSPPLCEGPGLQGLQARAPTDLGSNLTSQLLPPCVILSTSLSLTFLISEVWMVMQEGQNTMSWVKCPGEGPAQGPTEDTGCRLEEWVAA